MSSEYIKHNGQRVKKKDVISRGKKYKYNKAGKIVRIGGTDPDTGLTVTQGADDFVIGGTKSSLRRIADIESNVAILYTKLTTSDGDATDASESSDDVTIGKSNQTTRFKGDVKFDKEVDAKSSATVTSTFANKVIAAGSGVTTSRSLSAGNGLTGGGNLSANRTFHVGGGNGISVSANGVAMSGSYTGSFTATGDITAYSDDSLKTNVEVIDGALGRVEAIRGVTFERIEDGSVSTGVIAQELEAVLPEAVKTDEDGLKHVAYGNITGLLIEAVKELSAQVEELKKNK